MNLRFLTLASLLTASTCSFAADAPKLPSIPAEPTAKKKELVELEAAAELGRSWSLIDAQVRDAKQADRLTLLAKPMPGLFANIHHAGLAIFDFKFVRHA